ncbi:MAG: hypothetical protein HQL13_05940 [Candidatus Omnitrophica bacterium]|nr:hypothetical protein [Candidatus Omnitrophota bacterium]
MIINLSPYEKDRIIPHSFGLTEMGRDLLAEDYILKQITASLIYPEDKTGQKFWKRVYEEAQRKFGMTNVPVNTFNKVWIVPEKAVVYENAKAGTAYVVESQLKVMLEEDYLALKKQLPLTPSLTKEGERNMIPSLFLKEGVRRSSNEINALGSRIVREIVIPKLTQEVNEGKNFALLRQVYNSLILATWYKKKIKDSIINQVYADKNKVAGVGYAQSLTPLPNGMQKGTGSCFSKFGFVIPAKAGIQNQSFNKIHIKLDSRFRGNDSRRNGNDIEFIYERYLQAFKKGVFNYIKEDHDLLTQEIIPRKYFSGGMFLSFAMSSPGSSTALKTSLQLTSDPRVIGKKGLSGNFEEVDVNCAMAASSLTQPRPPQLLNRPLRSFQWRRWVNYVRGKSGKPDFSKDMWSSLYRSWPLIANMAVPLDLKKEVYGQNDDNFLAIAELIDNSIDATLKKNGIFLPMGRFGRGSSQALRLIKNVLRRNRKTGGYEGDYVSYVSAHDDLQEKRLVYFKGLKNDEIFMDFEKHGIAQESGTLVQIRTSCFSNQMDELIDFVVRTYSKSNQQPTYVNDKLINPLNGFKRWSSEPSGNGSSVSYQMPNARIDIRIYKDKQGRVIVEVEDKGTGMSDQTFLSRLPRPGTGENTRQMLDQMAQDDRAKQAEILVDNQVSDEMELSFEIASRVIEPQGRDSKPYKIQSHGAPLCREMVFKVPLLTPLTDAKNSIEVDEHVAVSFRRIISHFLAFQEGDSPQKGDRALEKQGPVPFLGDVPIAMLNSFLAIARMLDEKSSSRYHLQRDLVNQVEQSRFFFDYMRQHQVVLLPAMEGIQRITAPTGKKVVLLDRGFFEGIPRLCEGVFPQLEHYTGGQGYIVSVGDASPLLLKVGHTALMDAQTAQTMTDTEPQILEHHLNPILREAGLGSMATRVEGLNTRVTTVLRGIPQFQTQSIRTQEAVAARLSVAGIPLDRLENFIDSEFRDREGDRALEKQGPVPFPVPFRRMFQRMLNTYPPLAAELLCAFLREHPEFVGDEVFQMVRGLFKSGLGEFKETIVKEVLLALAESGRSPLILEHFEEWSVVLGLEPYQMLVLGLENKLQGLTADLIDEAVEKARGFSKVEGQLLIEAVKQKLPGVNRAWVLEWVSRAPRLMGPERRVGFQVDLLSALVSSYPQEVEKADLERWLAEFPTYQFSLLVAWGQSHLHDAVIERIDQLLNQYRKAKVSPADMHVDLKTWRQISRDNLFWCLGIKVKAWNILLGKAVVYFVNIIHLACVYYCFLVLFYAPWDEWVFNFLFITIFLHVVSCIRDKLEKFLELKPQTSKALQSFLDEIQAISPDESHSFEIKNSKKFFNEDKGLFLCVLNEYKYTVRNYNQSIALIRFTYSIKDDKGGDIYRFNELIQFVKKNSWSTELLMEPWVRNLPGFDEAVLNQYLAKDTLNPVYLSRIPFVDALGRVGSAIKAEELDNKRQREIISQLFRAHPDPQDRETLLSFVENQLPVWPVAQGELLDLDGPGDDGYVPDYQLRQQRFLGNLASGYPVHVTDLRLFSRIEPDQFQKLTQESIDALEAQLARDSAERQERLLLFFELGQGLFEETTGPQEVNTIVKQWIARSSEVQAGHFIRGLIAGNRAMISWTPLMKEFWKSLQSDEAAIPFVQKIQVESLTPTERPSLEIVSRPWAEWVASIFETKKGQRVSMADMARHSRPVHPDEIENTRNAIASVVHGQPRGNFIRAMVRNSRDAYRALGVQKGFIAVDAYIVRTNEGRYRFVTRFTDKAGGMDDQTVLNDLLPIERVKAGQEFYSILADLKKGDSISVRTSQGKEQVVFLEGQNTDGHQMSLSLREYKIPEERQGTQVQREMEFDSKEDAVRAYGQLQQDLRFYCGCAKDIHLVFNGENIETGLEELSVIGMGPLGLCRLSIGGQNQVLSDGFAMPQALDVQEQIRRYWAAVPREIRDLFFSYGVVTELAGGVLLDKNKSAFAQEDLKSLIEIGESLKVMMALSRLYQEGRLLDQGVRQRIDKAIENARRDMDRDVALARNAAYLNLTDTYGQRQYDKVSGEEMQRCWYELMIQVKIPVADSKGKSHGRMSILDAQGIQGQERVVSFDPDKDGFKLPPAVEAERKKVSLELPVWLKKWVRFAAVLAVLQFGAFMILPDYSLKPPIPVYSSTFYTSQVSQEENNMPPAPIMAMPDTAIKVEGARQGEFFATAFPVYPHQTQRPYYKIYPQGKKTGEIVRYQLTVDSPKEGDNIPVLLINAGVTERLTIQSNGKETTFEVPGGISDVRMGHNNLKGPVTFKGEIPRRDLLNRTEIERDAGYDQYVSREWQDVAGDWKTELMNAQRQGFNAPIKYG